MILRETGQVFQYGKEKFMVGGLAAILSEPSYGLCGLIKELNSERNTALCDFGGCDTEMTLKGMTSLALEASNSTGQMYVLYYTCDGPDDQSVEVQGVSASKQVLLRLMLDHLKRDPALEMVCGEIDTEKDSLSFTYEDEKEAFSLHYHIVPAAAYSKADGGMAYDA